MMRKRKANDSLPILGFLIKNGNKTVYEWRTGIEPKQIEKKQEAIYNFNDEASDNNDENQNDDKIDFDVIDFNVDTNVISTDDVTEYKYVVLNLNI
jgi:hypothetical protein